MYCPRCGQQQISSETKFCSRCGFQMGLIPELLANNGMFPQLAELYQQKQGWFTRKNGVIFSLLWFVTFVMMIPAFAGLANSEELAAGSAVFGLFTTILLMIFSLGFLKKSQKTISIPALEARQAQATGLYGSPQNQHALPPQQSVPVSSYTAPHGAWRDTNDLVPTPGSVTDSTTKLLTKDE